MRNIPYCIFIFATALIQSCATIVNSPITSIKIHPTNDSQYVKIKDDTTRYSLPARIMTLRKRENLYLSIFNKDQVNVITIPSTLSSTFWIGNLFCGLGLIGYGVDLFTPKRFTYPRNIYFESDVKKYKKYPPSCPHTFNLLLSLPEGNLLFLNNGNTSVLSAGFLGFCSGLEYYDKKNYFFQLNTGIIADFPIPFPAIISHQGNYEKANVWFADIQRGIDYNSFKLSVGIGYIRNTYIKRRTNKLFPKYQDTLLLSYTENRVGSSFSLAYKVNHCFQLGLNYKPSFFDIDNSRINYSHVFFFTLLINVEIYRPFEKMTLIKNQEQCITPLEIGKI